MNDDVRTQLQYIIGRCGISICEDARRCEAMLRDLCPECKREIHALVNAIKENIPQELMRASKEIPKGLLLSQLSKRLCDNLGIIDDLARWAVESWAILLDLDKEDIFVSSQVKKSDRLQSITEFGPAFWECSESMTQPKPLTQNQPPVPRRQEVQEKNTWTEPVTGMTFEWIPGSIFKMGSSYGETGLRSDEAPVHWVELDGFWMGKTEVTNAQYRRWKHGHRSLEYQEISLNGDTQPAVFVSWEDARDFAKWLSQQSCAKYTFELPSEAQWEYACRSGTTTSRYWGDNPDEACIYANVADQKTKVLLNWPGKLHNFSGEYEVTAPVASFKPNAFGLYDMLGNVWEWCEDVYTWDRYCWSANRKNPIYTSGGFDRVIRGGSWCDGPVNVRCASRDRRDPGFRGVNLGFRLLRKP
jgi:formylglycine-generating enzyme required for sulfatase activity